MREIRFRGKFNKDSKWEYGGLRFGDMGQAYILPHGATHRVELVNRSTVGQYTGLKDKNGVEIYEGDILRNHLKNQILTVVWDDEIIGTQGGGWDYKKLEHDKEWTWAIHMGNIEVIGNIHEHRHLLNDDPRTT